MATYTVESTGRTYDSKKSSGADETLLTDADYAAVQKAKQDFAAAQAAGDQAGMEAAHAAAERVRAGYQYSGGADGSQYIRGAGYPVQSAGGGSSSYASAPSYQADISAQRALLDQWKAEATRQAQAQIDYAVNQAVTGLERDLADAQPQFREQAESVSRDERQALDNSALYAELRGDRGGIGQAQYNEIQAQAAENRLVVQQAQTKLATDAARQIDDLRAQGEFDKADAALQISQSYMSQLSGLEQWAAEYNLSAAQFQASLQQWQAEYDMAMEQFRYGQYRDSVSDWQYQNDWNYQAMRDTVQDRQAQAEQAYQTQQDAKKMMASMGQALLKAGVMPSAAQLEAMGITREQAQKYVWTVQLKNQK